MQSKAKCLKLISELRAKYALEWNDENLAATIHIKNKHSLDIQHALEQSSHSGDDKGIDAWYYKDAELYIYQSKLSENKALVINGLKDFKKALGWIEMVLIDGVIDKIPNNPCLYNLYSCLSSNKDKIKKINFILISLYNSNEIEDRQEVDEFIRDIQKSRLMEYAKSNSIKFGDGVLEEYSFDSSIPITSAIYEIYKLEHSTIDLRETAYLDLAYISLYSLIELYRRRGELLFDKNVRLSLNSKDAKDRLIHPMEETLSQICNGELNPSIFPFYHVGVTIAAKTNSKEGDLMSIEEPSIINGCQTITIASKFYDGLEKRKETDKIVRFKEIRVVAKVVTGTKDEELREITNSNNRQNPIEHWQLFSNEPIHIEIEASLKAIGIFYERQKGKFESIMKYVDKAAAYPNTNNTYLNIVDLGQLIALGRGNLQWAAKPSDIFINAKNHRQIFDNSMPKFNFDMVFVSNAYKALKRGLANYLEMPAHSDERTALIFKRPILKAHLYYVGLLYFYQMNSKEELRSEFINRLNKIASQHFTIEAETLYQKIISKTKTWYLSESNNLDNDVSSKKLWILVQDLSRSVGVNIGNGQKPFTDSSINWTEYK